MKIPSTTGRTELSKAAVMRRPDAYALLDKQRWRGTMAQIGECEQKVFFLS